MKHKSQFSGIILGVLYGLLIRMISGEGYFEYLYNIYSISFIWITPMIIGLFPILFANTEIYKSKWKLFFYPVITILLFLISALLTRIEDLVCLLIIGFPFLIAAGIIGIIMGLFVKNRIKNKALYSILLLPLVLNPIENALPNKTETFTVSTAIIINTTKETIFPNLLEVPTISENEYSGGFFQKIGIPRPVESKIFKTESQLYRIGVFTDNLKLYETVSEIKPNEFVNFKIDLNKSTLRNTPTDQHLLKNDYFDFENINYTLIPMSNNKTKVILNCEYTLRSKMNSYANFWAESIIKDFEERLLTAIKHKLEENLITPTSATP